MVDFQSRDTSRGLSDDADDEAGDTSETATGTGTDQTGEDEGAGEAGPDEQVGQQTAAEPGFAVVSVGDDRTINRDPAGDAILAEIDAAGGHVARREVIDASYDGVQNGVSALVDRGDIAAVITTGSTGVEPDDVAIDAIEPMLDRTLPGFGELLRLLSYEDAGSAVIRTRATAGIIDGVPVFCLPGDPSLASRGVRELVVPEAETIADLAGATTQHSDD